MKNKRGIHSTYPEAQAQKLSIKEASAAYGVPCGVVCVREAKDQLSSLLDRAERGERIVVTSDGRPKAMIVRYRPMIEGAKWTSLRELREKTTMLRLGPNPTGRKGTAAIEAMYVDTSVMLKLFVAEPDSDACETIVSGATLVSSGLLHCELRSAVLAKVSRGMITAGLAAEVWRS